MLRIDSGTILVAFFAILFGLVGAFLLRKSLQSKAVVEKPQAEVRRGPAKVTVPLASRNLESGSRITLDDIALFSLTREEMKKHGIKRVFMSNPDQIIGKTVAVDLKRGATFDTKDFYAPGTGPGIADKLEAGQRAVTIEVTPTNALLGFAGAGQNVDVLFHYGQNSGSSNAYGDRDLNDRYNNDSSGWEPEHFAYNAPQGLSDNGANRNYRHRRGGGSGKKYQSATVTLVQKATILALGQRVIQNGNSSQISPEEERVRVTLAVKPESAELIRVAEGHGELSLTLRSASDDEILETDGPATLGNIIKMEEPVLVAKREVRDLDVYRGQSRSSIRLTRDRDTGHDDFQKWMLVEPKENANANNGAGSTEDRDNATARQLTDSADGPSAYLQQSNNSNSADERWKQNQEWPRQQDLKRDFRKIRTLFNQEPESRERSLKAQPAKTLLRNPETSNDVSAKDSTNQVRTAKVVELYDPRSFE